jgi:hypothetical protein
VDEGDEKPVRDAMRDRPWTRELAACIRLIAIAKHLAGSRTATHNIVMLSGIATNA